MSEREEHNELIHRLAERLRNHTEPYKDGAWERFEATYGKRRRALWPYWSAAAVLLAVVGSYWLTRHSDEFLIRRQHAQEDVVLQSAIPPAYEDSAPDEAVPAAIPQVAARPAVSPKPATTLEWGHADTVQRSIAVASEALHGEVPMKETVAEADNVPTPANEPQRLAVAVGQNQPEEQSGMAQGIFVQTPQEQDGGMAKWDLGLMISPSLTSESVNIGGGLTVAYRITDKLSIGSGIAVAQLGVGENRDYRPGYSSRQPNYLANPNDSPGSYPVFNGESASALDYKQEVSMTSSVVTLDIPVDVRYEVVKGFYTSIGVSYVTVLSEQRTGHYIDKINANTFVNGHSGGADRLASTEFTYSSEKIPAKPLQGNGYAGFMNFSIGKKLPISNKLFLSVEPYFKLPIGRLSKEEMDFTNGGIRIVTGF